MVKEYTIFQITAAQSLESSTPIFETLRLQSSRTTFLLLM